MYSPIKKNVMFLLNFKRVEFMVLEKYLNETIDILNKIKGTQAEKIHTAAKAVASVIENKGLVYIFGCGHSHLIALDCFYRAGGLANVSAMLDTDLMLHNGAAKSSKMEKMSGIAESVLERYCLTENDLLIIVSTSGKNAVPVHHPALRAGHVRLCRAGWHGPHDPHDH